MPENFYLDQSEYVPPVIKMDSRLSPYVNQSRKYCNTKQSFQEEEKPPNPKSRPKSKEACQFSISPNLRKSLSGISESAVNQAIQFQFKN